MGKRVDVEGISRRDLLKRGAIGGLIWATPAVQGVAMLRDAAQAASGDTGGDAPGGCAAFSVVGHITCPTTDTWGFRFTMSGHTLCPDCTRIDGTLYVDGTKVLGFANSISGLTVDPWTTPGDIPYPGFPRDMPSSPVTVRFVLLCRPDPEPGIGDPPVATAVWETTLTSDFCST